MKDNKKKERFYIKLITIESHGVLLQSLIVGKINELEKARLQRIFLKNDHR